MSLKEQISKDLTTCMKKRDLPRVKTLRFLQAAIKNKMIELRPEPLKDEHIVGILKKQSKQLKESLEYYKKAGYKDQIDEDEFQLSVLKSYLPKTLSEDELKKIVCKEISHLKAQSLKDMGSVMKAVMTKAKGSADGSMLSQIVREELSKI